MILCILIINYNVFCCILYWNYNMIILQFTATCNWNTMGNIATCCNLQWCCNVFHWNSLQLVMNFQWNLLQYIIKSKWILYTFVDILYQHAMRFMSYVQWTNHAHVHTDSKQHYTHRYIKTHSCNNNMTLNHSCLRCGNFGSNLQVCFQCGDICVSSTTLWRWSDLVRRELARTGAKKSFLISTDTCCRKGWARWSHCFLAISGANVLTMWCRKVLEANGCSTCRRISFRIYCVPQ